MKMDFDKMLNCKMKDLLGVRVWNKWKKKEPEMYNSILLCLYDYGKKKWAEAQSSAAKRSRERSKKQKIINGFPISITPFKT